MMFVFWGLAWAVAIRLRFEVDPQELIFSVTWLRWPLPARTQVFPLSDVKGVEVQQDCDSDGTVRHNVVLVVAGRDAIDLFKVASPNYSDQVMRADRISALLQLA
jgi:hypothetical protein